MITSVNRWLGFTMILGLCCIAGCGGVDTEDSSATQQCSEKTASRFSEVLACYRATEALRPLTYVAGQVSELSGVQKRQFTLTSQHWSPDGLVQPSTWNHDVVIYVPYQPHTGRALLVANNGINNPSADVNAGPGSDFTEENALAMARQTNTIIVVVNNVPNQFLTYADDGRARAEDSSVAHSWKLFLESPLTRPSLPLHVPMMESLVKTMDLAVKELQPWHIQSFIVTGASKRAWAAWLAAISDPRIDAIVPFVIDILGTDQVLDHTYQSYGNNWPLAFDAYLRENITAQRKTGNFARLLQIVDPLQYLHSAYADRLAIPKYIINASGDDFFVPDNTRYYLDQLPGVKVLRVAPNSDHYGILNYLESSLVPVVNRLQRNASLPVMTLQSADRGGSEPGGIRQLRLVFSEPPVKVVQWAAANPVARDFRYACGIRYEATPLTAAQNQIISFATPARGWQASFIEAQFSDGFVMTTPVQIAPDTYPTTAPLESGPTCKSIPEPSA